MNNKCIYYVEGPCEQQLIAALKEAPERLIPGKIKVFNVVQNLIPKSQMLSIQAGTTVVLVFVQYVENGCVYFTEVGIQEYIAKCTHRAKPMERAATYRKPRSFRR